MWRKADKILNRTINVYEYIICIIIKDIEKDFYRL